MANLGPITPEIADWWMVRETGMTSAQWDARPESDRESKSPRRTAYPISNNCLARPNAGSRALASTSGHLLRSGLFGAFRLVGQPVEVDRE
jgi:hypothetical protein